MLELQEIRKGIFVNTTLAILSLFSSLILAYWTRVRPPWCPGILHNAAALYIHLACHHCISLSFRFSVLGEFFNGFAVLDDFFFGFAVSSIPQCPPPKSPFKIVVQLIDKPFAAKVKLQLAAKTLCCPSKHLQAFFGSLAAHWQLWNRLLQTAAKHSLGMAISHQNIYTMNLTPL